MNIGKHLILTSLIFSCGMHGLLAQEAVKTEETTTTTTTTKTVITETVVKEKPAWQKMKVCVMDFTTIDIEGQKRFLDVNNKPIVIPGQNTLNDDDHKTVNGVMQGFVRMIDAWDGTRTNKANREGQIGDNLFTRDKALSIYAKTVEGEPRPVVIGADYLTAYLGRYNDVFVCMSKDLVGATMMKIRQQPDFPQDFMLKVAQASGATHLIYGTLSDIRTRENHFKGYGIETHTINYDMDVIIKVVDLVAQHTVFSNVYTSSYNERRPVSNAQFDKAIYQNLMTSALQQAAEELYELCKPGEENKIRPTPLPQNN
ncbi:MAG: hypothetical protein IKR62_03030 [Victivallales bacterium]|nr:hypothetical protein [Victivallales bacterium]